MPAKQEPEAAFVTEASAGRNKLFLELKNAIRAGVPLIAIQTADPQSALRIGKDIVDEKNTRNFNAPLISWNVASGLMSYNDAGKQAIATLLTNAPGKKQNEILDPLGTLKLIQALPERSIIFMLNLHRFIGSADAQQAVIGQAIWNLRDKFKNDNRMLIFTGPAPIRIPPELSQDILVLDEPFPEKEVAAKVITELHATAKVEVPSKIVMDRATEAVRGLSYFSMEQAVALSFSRQGFSLETLWHLKRKMVENTVGLNIYRGKETYADVKGVPTVREFITELFNGEDPPTGLVFLDEMEKMFGGIQGDLSGATQDQLGEFLRWTQDEGVLAMMEIGHPGCTKSFLAKATAGQFGVPMIELNVSALKGKLQGQTGEQTRAAFKTISAICRPLLMCTSNSMTIFPSELKRRFNQGIWVFDLPGDEVKSSTWDLYISKFKLTKDQVFRRPDDTNWTPAEIENCCRHAWRRRITLEKAGNYVVPIYKADPEKVEKLRKDCSGRYLSADYDGEYIGNTIVVKEGRKLTPVGEA